MKAGRPPRSSAKTTHERRREILDRLIQKLLAEPARLSLRELARVADVTVPTLRHHFRDRAGVTCALFKHLGEIGQQHHHPAIETTNLPVAQSLPALTARLAEGFSSPLLAIHQLGLLEGFADPGLGRSYLQHILEPSLQSVERRLALHMHRGELKRSLDPRIAAIELVAPLFVAALHQCTLGGDEVRHLDLPDLARGLAKNFLKIHRPIRPSRRKYIT